MILDEVIFLTPRIKDPVYSIIDIETTGGNAVRNKIIEIAIFNFDGEKVIDQYQTLINPERTIPSYIESFTGITNQMVQDAPKFYEIAEKIVAMTEGKVFVAHNVNFDFSFIKKEFSELGFSFRRKKLCTVRLSRAIFPDMPSYGLGGLCSELDISITNRHRAGGDGAATVRLFQELIKRDREDFITYSLNRNSKEAALPPNLPKEKYDALPEEMGVYYFHDDKGNIVYIGKANNIQKRVSSHFLGNTNTNKRQLFLNSIHDVSYEICGTELIALLYESFLIKKHWPRFNRAQRRVEMNYAIYKYEDRNGYLRFSISRLNQIEKPVITFRYLVEARNFLAKKVREHQLCAKLTGLQKVPHECYDYKIEVCKGACIAKEAVDDYNSRVINMLDDISNENKSFAIIGPGRSSEEQSLVMVEEGIYLGFGYFSREESFESSETMKDHIQSYPDNPDVQTILMSQLRKSKDLIIEF